MRLRIEELRTCFAAPAGDVWAVNGVGFEIARGQTLALVGESGSGKTLTALSILRLVPPPGRIVAGRILLDGVDLLSLPERQMRAVRGDRIAMIFQEPMTSLNPLMPVGEQVAEPLRLHRRLSTRAAHTHAVELLRSVGIPAAEQRARDYPHRMSDGMRQRVMIAMALACEPEVLIADEPTSALDVTVQAQILALLRDLQRQRGLSLLFITHDLGVVAQIADTVCVMYAGRVVERAPVGLIFAAPRHPYTQGLLRSTPRLTSGARSATRSDPGGMSPQRLPVIPGEVPDPAHLPPGCPFHPRCALGGDDPTCRTREPPLAEVAPEHACACWKAAGYPAALLGRASEPIIPHYEHPGS